MLVDRYNRKINYLRISVTDRCNLRCIYCMPKEGIPKLSHKEILRYEELLKIVRVAVQKGISKFRITGGEPLIRKDVIHFIQQLANIPGVRDISLTTNGVLLYQMAEELYNAGIHGINVSMDTLDPTKYMRITGRDYFNHVWRGIEHAEQIGFFPIKLNVVVMRGLNDDEILDFAKLTLDKPYHIRFIEFMPIGPEGVRHTERFISGPEIKSRIQALRKLIPVKSQSFDGPARRFKFRFAKGEIGFISPLSHPFCSSCNRLRLTADGKLRGCLFSDEGIDIKTSLRNGCSHEELGDLLISAITHKPKGHHFGEETFKRCASPMIRIGG
ncbi:MAG TPA: GTP 3',8-cyclase MoaA [Syntrophaceae bacterium]|nr:GTP 3',8-cyclase MoaA [Syntrophaceae bacterium]